DHAFRGRLGQNRRLVPQPLHPCLSWGRRARARFGSIPTIVDGMTDGAAASNAKPPTTVGELMSSPVATAAPDETVAQVAARMRGLMRLARILPVEQLAVEAPRGLEGAIVAETELGDVRGLEGFYHFRQYDAIELAEGRTFEDVWYLLHRGHLPSKAEREAF